MSVETFKLNYSERLSVNSDLAQTNSWEVPFPSGVEEALVILDTILKQECLSDIQELVFRHSWEGKTYPEIAEISGYDANYIKDVGYKLWQLLSKAVGKEVTKSNFRSLLKQLSRSLTKGVAQHPQLATVLTVPVNTQVTKVKTYLKKEVTGREDRTVSQEPEMSITFEETEQLQFHVQAITMILYQNNLISIANPLACRIEFFSENI